MRGRIWHIIIIIIVTIVIIIRKRRSRGGDVEIIKRLRHERRRNERIGRSVRARIRTMREVNV